MRRLSVPVGERFGNWEVLSAAIDNSGHSRWVCKCHCNLDYCIGTSTLNAASLRKGRTTSCDRRKAMPRDVGFLNKLYCHVRDSAKERKYEFTLTRDDVAVIMQQPCSYCGSPPRTSYRVTKKGMPDILPTNGIDRIDNARGYTQDNIVSCCTFCNRAKHIQSVEDFEAWLDRVAAFRRKD